MATRRTTVSVGYRSAPRRSERGSVLVISLLLLLVVAFLGALILLLAQTETGLDTSTRSAALSFNAAEYALDMSINQFDPFNAKALGTKTIPGVGGVMAWGGLRNGAGALPAIPPDVQAGIVCPPGSPTWLKCDPFDFNATGQSGRFFVVTAVTQVQSRVAIPTGGTTDGGL